MTKDEGKQEKFDFTPEGEALRYIGLAQPARALWAVVVLSLFLFWISSCDLESVPPYKATPPPDIISFIVEREWEIPAGGYGAEIRVDDSASKEEVLRLGQWLLRGDSDVLFHIDNSGGRQAVVRRLFEGDGDGLISWFKGGGITETIHPDGRVEVHPPRPSMDMSIDELKTFAKQVEYEELYLNFDKYSIVTWRKTGGLTPLLYFEGEIQTTEVLSGLLEGVWSAQLLLPDSNHIVFNHDGPTLMVGDFVEVVGVCEQLETFQTIGAGLFTVPFCIAWQIAPLSTMGKE